MNYSIVSVNNAIKNPEVRDITSQLIANPRRAFRIGFIKKDKTERFMTIVPKHSWNDSIGIKSTPSGIAMVRTKVNHGMITVNELYIDEDGKTVIRPRTINLMKVFSFEMLHE